MSIYDDDNPCWPEPPDELPGWEPWEDYEPEPADFRCAYCESTDVRPDPEPFGQQPCCDACFNVLIGGEPGDPPWRCGTNA
jgi:hypothetical protein